MPVQATSWMPVSSATRRMNATSRPPNIAVGSTIVVIPWPWPERVGVDRPGDGLDGRHGRTLRRARHLATRRHVLERRKQCVGERLRLRRDREVIAADLEDRRAERLGELALLAR